MPGVVQTDPSWRGKHLSPERWYLPWALTSEACPRQCLPRGPLPSSPRSCAGFRVVGAMGHAGPGVSHADRFVRPAPWTEPGTQGTPKVAVLGVCVAGLGDAPQDGDPQSEPGPGETRTYKDRAQCGPWKKTHWRGTPASQHRKSPSQRLPDPHVRMLRHPGGGWGPPCPPGSLRAVSFLEGWGQVPWWQGVRGAVWAEG